MVAPRGTRPGKSGMTAMAKIKVANPIVELDGDEMARIKNKLTLSYFAVDVK